MALDREQIASDAVARLLDAQMPWGEWGAIGESPEIRYAERIRPEYRYSPIPKANVFRTVLALDCLSHVEPCDIVTSAIQRASAWLEDRLLEKNAHPQAPEGGVWTAHVAIPAGIGLGFDIPDLVCIIDLRHTSQAWNSFLRLGKVAAVDDQLMPAMARVADAADKKDGLWGNIQGSEKTNNFASACCVSFLQCALQVKYTREAIAALARACVTLPGKLEEALQPQITPQAAEEAGRSLWIVARSGLQQPFQSVRNSLERRLRGLISEETLPSFRAGIRLTAAARAFDWAVKDDWIMEQYAVHRAELHPPDLAFVVLALGNPAISGVEELRRPDYRRLLLHVALQERLEVFEWLEDANRELSAERLKQEQFSYICRLVAENELAEWSFLKDEIRAKNWEMVRAEIERLEVFRQTLLSGRDAPAFDMAGARREVTAALREVSRKEVRRFLGRVLYACCHVREYHKKKRFPRDLLASEEHVQHLLALELDTLGFHTGGFEEQVSPGNIDFHITEPGAELKMIVECKFAKRKEDLDLQRQAALRDANDWAEKERQAIRAMAETGVRQVERYPGFCCRIVFMCCLFPVDFKEALTDDSFHPEVRRQGNLDLVIVWMHLYFWMEAASQSARKD